MPPLVTFEEALALAEISERGEIEELIERAWNVRTERFADSTDMCSLVNAKSGGCAEDCGFCAQSRYAAADTPMHAMMEPEQMLEHAKAAEAAGADGATSSRRVSSTRPPSSARQRWPVRPWNCAPGRSA